MEEEKFDFSYDDEIMQAVRKFENMKSNNEKCFFDVEEFESIIDFYMDNNNMVRACEAVTIASEQHPTSVSIQLRKAKVYLEKGKALEALSILKRLESIESGNFEVFLAKGTALCMLGNIQGAVKMYDYALSLADEEEEDVEDVLFSMVSVLQNLNYYEQVLPYLKKLIALEPSYKALLYDLAYAFDKVDDFENGIKYYCEYLDDDPFSDSAWYNLGIIYNKIEQYDKAIEAFNYAIAINPENAFAIFNKANILFNRGNYHEAIQSYSEYLEYEPDSFEAMTYIAESYEKIHDFDSAKKYYMSSLEIAPDYADTWFGLGLMEFEEDHIEKSGSCFLKATKLDGSIAEYWYYLGKTSYLQKNIKTALRCFKEALKIDIYYDIVWYEIGKVVFEKNIVPRVIHIFEQASRMIGEVPGLEYLLSAFYLNTGDVKNSYKHLSGALNIDRDSYRVFSDMFPVDSLPKPIVSLLSERKLI